MAEYSKLYITNNGQALMAKMIAGSGNIDFTKICSSATQYSESQLQALTALSNIKQTTLVSKVTRTNEVAIKIEAALSNVDLKEGYYMRTIGLYAIDPDKGEMKDTYSKIKDNYNCPFNLIDDLIGGKWKLRIVAHIINGDNRFSILQKKIDDITPKVLMSQLKELEASGLINRNVIKEMPPKIVVYEINKEYSDIVDIVDNLEQFAKGYSNRNDIATENIRYEK